MAWARLQLASLSVMVAIVAGLLQLAAVRTVPLPVRRSSVQVVYCQCHECTVCPMDHGALAVETHIMMSRCSLHVISLA